MSRIFITGDTHGEIDISKLSNVKTRKFNFTSEDYLIICGDFGCVWNGDNKDKCWLDWLSAKPYTTLFVDGNHENFDLLEQYPISSWHGGDVQLIRPNVIHLMRGQIYNINNKIFFTMGGAASTDKYLRKEGVSWWRQEMPSSEELQTGLNNLDTYDNNVDYIITHCAPNEVLKQINPYYERDSLTGYLEIVRQTVDFKKWFMGHYHEDREFGGKYLVLYNKIVEIA